MSATPMMDVITFGDLSDGTIRITPPLVKGERCFFIQDSIMVFSDKDKEQAKKTWSDISEVRKAEIAEFITTYRVPGQVIHTYLID